MAHPTPQEKAPSDAAHKAEMTSTEHEVLRQETAEPQVGEVEGRRGTEPQAFEPDGSGELPTRDPGDQVGRGGD